MLTGYQPVRLLSLLVIIILAGLSLPAQSLSTTSKERIQAKIDLAPYLQRLISDQQEISLDQARASTQWASIRGETNLGLLQPQQWIYLDLTPHISNKDPQLLEFLLVQLDRIDAYFYRNNQLVEHYISGDSVPFSIRPIKHKNLLFPLPNKEPNKVSIRDANSTPEKVEVYFKIYSEGSTNISSTLWNTKDFLIYDNFDSIWNGFFFGSIVILFIYHALLFIKLWKMDILAYLFSMTTILLFTATKWGYGIYIWPENTALSNIAIPVTLILANIGTLFFFYFFLSINKTNTFINRYTIALLVASVPLFVLAVSLPPGNSIVFIIIYGFIAFVSITLLALYLWINEQPVARYYFIAIIPTLMAGLVITSNLIGLIPSNYVTVNISELATLTSLCLLAMAVAYKISDKQTQSEQQIMRLNEDLENKVIARTHELNTSLDELKATQNQLIETEKMAALTSLVAGVAHEINTPLGVGITATTSLKENADKFKINYQANDLSRTDMEGFLDTAYDALELIENSFTRASQQVKSFKEITIEQSNSETHSLNMKEHIHNAFIHIKPIIVNHTPNLHIECSDTLEINSISNLFIQVFVNLMSNSVQHGFNKDQQGNIYIKINTEENKLHINYSDDGKGLSEKKISDIFNPFNTSNRSGGQIGLGTTITYNIITQALQGTISCEKPEDSGLSYHIEIPAEIIVG